MKESAIFRRENNTHHYKGTEGGGRFAEFMHTARNGTVIISYIIVVLGVSPDHVVFSTFDLDRARRACLESFKSRPRPLNGSRYARL